MTFSLSYGASLSIMLNKTKSSRLIYIYTIYWSPLGIKPKIPRLNNPGIITIRPCGLCVYHVKVFYNRMKEWQLTGWQDLGVLERLPTNDSLGGIHTSQHSQTHTSMGSWLSMTEPIVSPHGGSINQCSHLLTQTFDTSPAGAIPACHQPTLRHHHNTIVLTHYLGHRVGVPYSGTRGRELA